MRPSGISRPRRWIRCSRDAVLVFAILATGGCGALFRSTTPSGLSLPASELRHALAEGRYESALERSSPDADDAPDDELLRLLYAGIAAYYAGEYARSAEAFDRAVLIAEDRYTRSVSRGALSLVSSARALHFRPLRSERLMIHFYAALDFLRRGDAEEAAVEARRLSGLLARYEDDGWDCAGGRLCDALHYFAGAVFEAAGFSNEAAVAYRNAGALVDRLSPTDTLRGNVLVVLERGFVAHRVEESITVLLNGREARALAEAEDGERFTLAMAIAARISAEDDPDSQPRPRRRPPALARSHDADDGCERAEKGDSTTHVARGKWPRGGWLPQGSRKKPDPPEHDEDEDEKKENEDPCEEEDLNPYLLRVAWPVYRDHYNYDGPYGGATLIVPDGRRAVMHSAADLSHAVRTEFGGERIQILAHAIARAATKYGLSRGVEDAIDGENAWLGDLLGLAVNIGGAITERADTRSWHLLPDEIGLARLRLPPGVHDLALTLGNAGPQRRITVPSVRVRPGRLTIVAARVWPR